MKRLLITALILMTGSFQPAWAESADSNPLSGDQENSIIDHTAQVYQINGSAEISRQGTETWQALKNLEIIREGDRIKTAPNSTVDILYDHFYQNSARISANTVAVFESIEPTRLNLIAGELFNLLDAMPEGGSYEVSAPTAVAAIRGTHFSFRFDAASNFETTSVLKGSVQVYAVSAEKPEIHPDRSFTVPSNFSLEASASTESGKDAAKPLSLEALALLEAEFDSCRALIVDYAGGPEPFQNAATAWEAFKSNRSKQAYVLAVWKEHGKNKLQTVSFSSMPNTDEPVISAAVIASEEEARLQDSLRQALETFPAGSAPDENTSYEIVEEKQRTQ